MKLNRDRNFSHALDTLIMHRKPIPPPGKIHHLTIFHTIQHFQFLILLVFVHFFLFLLCYCKFKNARHCVKNSEVLPIHNKQRNIMTSIHLDEDFPAMFPTKYPPQNFYQISPHLQEHIKLIKCTTKSQHLDLWEIPHCLVIWPKKWYKWRVTLTQWVRF